MTSRHRRLASFFLVLALALAVIGQFYFAMRRAFLWDGVVFYGLALAFFVAALRLVAAARVARAPSPAGARCSMGCAGTHGAPGRWP